MTLDLERENARLERATPEQRLAFAAEHFGSDLLFTSSFGAQSNVLLHLWSVVCPELPVVFIDTGFLFPETLAYRTSIAERLGLHRTTVTVDLAAARERFVALLGELSGIADREELKRHVAADPTRVFDALERVRSAATL